MPSPSRRTPPREAAVARSNLAEGAAVSAAVGRPEQGAASVRAHSAVRAEASKGPAAGAVVVASAPALTRAMPAPQQAAGAGAAPPMARAPRGDPGACLEVLVVRDRAAAG